jgi:hypothetical protein
VPYAVAASATSGLPVALTIDAASRSVCSISGNTVSLIGAGTCTIDANQAGSTEYEPASQAQQSFAVAAYVPPPKSSSTPPSSAFTWLEARADGKTGAIIFTQYVTSPGTFKWLLTFQNGPFGAFASSTGCKAGLIRLERKCRPRVIVFALGSQVETGRGVVTFTVRPTKSGLRALRGALKRKRKLLLGTTITFQASPGGAPFSQTRSLSVKPRR